CWLLSWCCSATACRTSVRVSARAFASSARQSTSPMKSMSRRKRIQTNLTNLDLSNCAVGEHHFQAEVFGLFGRFQKYHRKRNGISRRQLETLERFEILQVRY